MSRHPARAFRRAAHQWLTRGTRRCYGPCKRRLPFAAFGKGTAPGGTAKCCRECAAAENAAYRAKRLVVGTCAYCTRAPLPGKRWCGTCAKRITTYSRQQADQRKAAGLCRFCDAPVGPGSVTYCAPHQAGQTALARTRQRRLRLQRAAHAWLTRTA